MNTKETFENALKNNYKVKLYNSKSKEIIVEHFNVLEAGIQIHYKNNFNVLYYNDIVSTHLEKRDLIVVYRQLS